eukprot:PhF_6_TR8461/c0_g1_i1/m.13214/K19872/FKTN; fukutin
MKKKTAVSSSPLVARKASESLQKYLQSGTDSKSESELLRLVTEMDSLASTADHTLSPFCPRQKNFHHTLALVDAAFRSCQIEYFLASGTALGAVREGRFIPHDDDIDIGVFRHRLPTSLTSEESVVRLVTAMKEQGLIVFDLLGELDHGLELRVRGSTGILVDINFFYKDICEDTAEEYLWFATYYGESDKRKYGKYRYRHSMFEPYPILFGDTMYNVPPEKYFVEYFGKDWRVPRKYDYWEGLKG